MKKSNLSGILVRIIIATVICHSLVSAAFALPAKVIILRHGEDRYRDSEELLEPTGLSHAFDLARNIDYWPDLNGKLPIALFSSSFHTVNTLKPLSNRLDIPLNIISTPKKFKRWVKAGQSLTDKKNLKASFYPNKNDIFIDVGDEDRVEILVKHLKKRIYRGRIVVICWVHREMKELVEELGYFNVPEWPEDEYGDEVYDRYWVLDFAQDKRDSDGDLEFSRRLNEHSINVLYGK